MTDLSSQQLISAILRSLNETARRFSKGSKTSVRSGVSARASASKKQARQNGVGRKHRV